MCALTEQVIFTDPYTSAKFNHWTTPQLDVYAEGIRNDSRLKAAALKLKELFLSSTQALLHGDLHSGSVMVMENSTFVIDPEFAFYGPMGFDLGAFISNLLLNYFSHESKGTAAGTQYAEWVLNQAVIFYETFEKDFLHLWTDAVAKGRYGELNSQCTGEAFQNIQKDYMCRLFADALGFTGMKMIRRIIGIAHVADLESIEDANKRSPCEKRCLVFARRLVLASQEKSLDGLIDIHKVVDLAKSLYSSISPDTWPH